MSQTCDISVYIVLICPCILAFIILEVFMFLIISRTSQLQWGLNAFLVNISLWPTHVPFIVICSTNLYQFIYISVWTEKIMVISKKDILLWYWSAMRITLFPYKEISLILIGWNEIDKVLCNLQSYTVPLHAKTKDFWVSFGNAEEFVFLMETNLNLFHLLLLKQ